MRAFLVLCLLGVTSGCDPATRKAAPSGSPERREAPRAAAASGTASVEPDAPGVPPAVASAREDDALSRRAYMPKELKLMPCAKLEAPDVIRATNCGIGVVVYGPYAKVTGGSQVELRFEVEATTTLGIEAEIVSGMGQHFYGSIPSQSVEKGARRSFALRVPVGITVEGLESRIIVASDDPATFTLHRMALTVL